MFQLLKLQWIIPSKCSKYVSNYYICYTKIRTVMKNLKLVAITFVLSLTTVYSKADEGMWLPFLLGRNYEDMKKHGLNLTAEQIYSINNSSIKDAIISFNGYCTGEVISDKGLILTNHHCGYEAIADVSTKEKNHLDNGFWAQNLQEEIKTSLFATFIIRIEDVTEKVASQLNASMTEAERNAKIQEIGRLLSKEAVNGTHYEAFVRDFFDGNEFYLFVTEKFLDVRLVGTPPQSAGKYGGDTDNWMWPRHTADFSMFRIYSGKDGKPAAYTTENIPLKPKHHLPISLKGVKDQDFAMIMGFPGRTSRYLTSYGIDQTVTLEKPKRVELRAIRMDVMKRHMDADVEVRLNYSSNYASTANYWKNFQGEILQVKNNKVIAKKQDIEREFTDFAKANAEYANVLPTMEASYKALDKVVMIKAFQAEFVQSIMASNIASALRAYKSSIADADRSAMILGRIKDIAANYFATSHMPLEAETVAELYKQYLKDIPADQLGTYSANLKKKGTKSINKVTKSFLTKSMIFDKAKFDKFMANPSMKALNKDPFFIVISDLATAYEAAISKTEIKDATENLSKATRSFAKGIREMQPNKKFYPNANSTMRMTYGQILPYSPADAVSYDYVTSLDGMFAKEDVTNPEFHIDEKIRTTWKNKDWGQYADAERGYVVCNFLSNNDITGGNSGSPVINADGHLIGTAFDGNWEAMSGNIFFEDKVQRTISCDIRYLLWLVDRVYGAQNIIDELTLVK